MCGIMGYTGGRKAKSILSHGLKSLEYRGYDSCGIAVTENDKLKIKKTKGRINLLEKEIKNLFDSAKTGIAHTRWATHGIANEINAHPHTDCKNELSIVHNGIIENYLELKTMLQAEGHRFKSQTDTEIFAHLVEKFLSEKESVEDSFINALKLIEGAYAIAMIHIKHPDKIFVARKSSPLVIGVGENEMFVASDTIPIMPYTRRVTFLKDAEVAILTPTRYEIKNLEKQRVAVEITELKEHLQEISKDTFADFMLKEILEQPKTVTNALKGRIDWKNSTARFGGINIGETDLKKLNKIILVGCGTSYHACLYGKYIFEDITKTTSLAEYASEFRYSKPVLDKNTLVILLSQSGETADTIAALKYAKLKNAMTLGIINVVGSTIAREVDGGIYLHAGPEIAVASTKTFTSHLVVLYLFSIYLARLKNTLRASEARKMFSALRGLSSKIQKILTTRGAIEKIASKYYKMNNSLYLSRSYNYPIAMEGSLKLKEVSYIHAEAMTSAEMKHGPIALIDKNTFSVFIAPQDRIYKKTLGNIEEIKSRKGKIIAITTLGNDKIKRIVDDVIFVPKTEENLLPVLTVIPTQLLSYYCALMRGCDIDKPRNLAKSVTVE